jgi:hypothetical protein
LQQTFVRVAQFDGSAGDEALEFDPRPLASSAREQRDAEA